MTVCRCKMISLPNTTNDLLSSSMLSINSRATPLTPRRAERKSLGQVKKLDIEEDKEIISSLQREQERLMEEVKAERKQCEKMKELYTRDLNLLTAHYQSIFSNLRNYMDSGKNNRDPNVIAAIKLVSSYESQEYSSGSDVPIVSELQNRVNVIEMESDKIQRENKLLKRSYRQNKVELDQLRAQVIASRERLEGLNDASKEVKDKLNTLKDKIRTREAFWKSKVSSLEARNDANA